MSTRRGDKRIVLEFAALILIIGMLACALPPYLNPGGSSNAPSGGGISPDVSTQVAATLYAHIALEQTSSSSEVFAQQTQLAQITDTPEAELMQPTDTAAIPSPSTMPEPSATASPTLPELPPPPPPPPLPPQYLITPMLEEGLTPIQPLLPPMYEPKGEGFDPVGVNITNCGYQKAINILIYNNANIPLESISLIILDQTSGSITLDQYVSDTPFYADNRLCSKGEIPLLEPGQALFIGRPASAPLQTGHNISSEIKICTNDGLQGTCYTQSIEFIAP